MGSLCVVAISDVLHRLVDLCIHKLDIGLCDGVAEEVLVERSGDVGTNDVAIKERLAEDASQKVKVLYV